MHKKRFHRKAQLTLFILIGVFMIGIFAFVWYLNTRVAQTQLQAPTEKLIADLLKTGSIPYYVGVCLEENAKEGLFLAGQQGGDIFLSEGGPAPEPSKYFTLGYKVTYGISAPFLVNRTSYPYPPGYPGGVPEMLQVPYLDFARPGRFGEVSLRKLCDTHGANNPFILGPSITMPICLGNIYADTLSTQWQLEQFVQKKVRNCTNWTAIREETGYNVTPTGDPNITFRLGLDDVWVDAYIPLVIEVGGREPVYTIGDFHARLPLRLKMLGQFMSMLATYDSYSLKFDINREYKSFYDWDSNIKVTVMTPLKPAVWDDIITVEDAASVLDGENYVFRFVRQNRHPALDWIRQDTNWTDYDIVLMENDTISIEPNPDVIKMGENFVNVTYDPDEDNLTYYYTGWKETCDERYDFETNNPRTFCSAKEPTEPRNYFLFPNKGATIDTTKWPPGMSWKDLYVWADLRYNPDLVDYPDEAPHAWTRSAEYIASGKNATFIPGHEDIGPHNVTVWVCDEAGLCDYQIVKILVVDYPLLMFNGTNPYSRFDPSIPYDAASVEDFYVLSADGSTGYVSERLGMIQGFIFTDKQEPFEIETGRDMMVLDLPLSVFGYERDIRYIWNFTFNRSSLCDTTPCPVSRLHEINLSIKNLPRIIPKQLNVTVHQCLPYRDPGNSDPWPYNTTSDAYLASHKCCSLGGSYNTTIDTSNLEDRAFHMTNGYGIEINKVIIYDPAGNNVAEKEYIAPIAGIFAMPLYSFAYGSDVSPELVIQEETGITISIDSNRITVVFPEDRIGTGTYTLEQTAKEPTTYPPWGAWFGVDQVCHGGIPQYGVMEYFNKEDEQFASELPEPTTTYKDKPDGYNPVFRNDIWVVDFRRFCSGDRGNVCTGLASKLFTQVKNCDDMRQDIGEIESCQGAPLSMKEPDMLTRAFGSCSPDTGCGDGSYICIQGKCYNRPAETCDKYTDTTFEETFGMNRTYMTGQVANGTCNPTETCGSSADDYGIDEEHNSGRYHIFSATCLNGACSKAERSEDCWNYNGHVGASLDSGWYCNLVDGSLISHNFTCSKAADGAMCDVDGVSDPDEAPELCDACRLVARPTNKIIATSSTYSRTRTTDTDKYCCGDDKGEGGFPYGATARRVSGLSGGGAYATEERVCDDYSGTLTSPIWIDNDCDGNVNCGDTGFCASGTYTTFRENIIVRQEHLGPGGSVCCGTSAQCANFLTPGSSDEVSKGGVACGENKECDCKPVGSPADFLRGTVYRTLTLSSFPLKTCVASSDESLQINRHISVTVTGSGAVTYRFKIDEQDLDGGSETCNGDKVQMTVYDSSKISIGGMIGLTENGIDTAGVTSTITGNYYIAFQNIVNKDCLVAVTIT